MFVFRVGWIEVVCAVCVPHARSDLTLAARPGGTHSVVLKISDVFLSLAALRHLGLSERRIRAPHRMPRHCEFSR
jgi:hypothetical protein